MAGGGDGPQPQVTPAVVVADFGLLTFSRREGTGEWDYPWDLTGGLYRWESTLFSRVGACSSPGFAPERVALLLISLFVGIGGGSLARHAPRTHLIWCSFVDIKLYERCGRITL